MAKPIDKRLKFSAIDKVSGVTERISNKFPKLSKNASRTQRNFERLDRSSAKLRGNLTRLGSSMKSTGIGMTAGLTLPIVAFGAKALETSGKFDLAMNKVQALSGATGSELLKLREEAKRLGSTTAFSASQASDAMGFFSQAGFDVNETFKATAPTLALASATTTDLGRTADIASNIMGGFNIKASEMTRVADVLALTTSKGNVNLEMMGESMKDSAPVALKYGATLEEVSALTAKLGDAGIQGSKAGTTLKNMFLQLTTATPKVQKILSSLGVQAIDPATGKMRKMTEILVQLNKGFKSRNISESKRLAVLNEVFGKRAIAGAGVLLESVQKMDPATGKVINSVAELEKKLINATGSAQRMQDTVEKGLPGAVNSFKSAWEGLQIAFMDSGIKDILVGIINGIADMFRWFSRLSPTVLKWAGIIASVVAVMGPMITMMGMLVGFLPSIITGFNMLALALPFIKAGAIAMLLPLSKFILIATGIGLLAKTIMENWEPIKSFFVDLFTDPLAILERMKKMAGWIGSLVGIKGLSESDSVDAKLRAQGFKIGGPEGEDSGSQELTKKNFEYKMRKQNASVDVKFSNMPKDARVTTEDRESLLNVDTGMMGFGSI